jgi:hypothetical protein
MTIRHFLRSAKIVSCDKFKFGSKFFGFPCLKTGGATLAVGILAGILDILA